VSFRDLLDITSILAETVNRDREFPLIDLHVVLSLCIIRKGKKSTAITCSNLVSSIEKHGSAYIGLAAVEHIEWINPMLEAQHC